MAVNFIFCLHNHKSPGDFDREFQRAYEDIYLPFLQILERYQDIKVCLYYSGALLEWLEKNQPAFFIMVRKMIENGQVEIIGGAFYEPIFILFPEDDLKGQLEMLEEYLYSKLGISPKGVWVTERVWEQWLVRPIVNSGYSYVILDDLHLRMSGLTKEQIDGYYTTEFEGKNLFVFPINEKIRYMLYKEEVAEVIDFIENFPEDKNSILICANNTEDEEMHKAFRTGWFEKFFEGILKKSGTIKFTTFSEVIQSVKPKGRVYLSHCSYDKMCRWWLSGQVAEQGKEVIFGNWRNFLTKYFEANLLYGRTLEVSTKLSGVRKSYALIRDAKKRLYKAQCNVIYWHGDQGDIYLPHLRAHAYYNLVVAENVLQKVLQKREEFGYETIDINQDGLSEIKIYNPSISLYIDPSRGGHIFEIDLRQREINILCAMSRYYEHYHHLIKDREIVIDHYPRESFIDRFLPAFAIDERVDTVYKKDMGDFNSGEYSHQIKKEAQSITVELKRKGIVKPQVGRHPYLILVQKIIYLKMQECEFEIHYKITNLSDRVFESSFLTELNLGIFDPNTVIQIDKGQKISAMLDDARFDVKSLINIYGNFDMEIGVARDTIVKTTPVFTITKHQDKFNNILQGILLVLNYPLNIESNQTWQNVLTFRFS
jgi:alpha-amylase